MTETKSKGPWGSIAGFLAFVGVVLLLSWGIIKIDNAAQLRKDFHAVCDYEGGTVHGDVCTKDDEVILYKKTLDSEHQD
jgi:hypothetical protein